MTIAFPFRVFGKVPLSGRALLFALSLLSLLFVALPATSEAREPEPLHVRISFAPETQSLETGAAFRIAVVQTIDPLWHTYWRNPGDSGTGMKISWTLPEGFSVGGLDWPVPERIPSGPLMNFGYSSEAVFFQHFTAPRRLPEGSLTFIADVELLVCKDICIPEISRHSFTLGAADSPAPDPDLFARAQKRIPEAVEAKALYHEENGLLNLALSSGDSTVMNALKMGSADLFPEEWGIIDNPSKTRLSMEKDVVTLLHPRGPRPLAGIGEMKALISFPDGNGGRRGIYVSAQPDKSKPFAPAPTDGPDDAGEEDLAPEGSGAQPESKPSGGETGFLHAVFLALLGGLILNLMPCVFPVLSIKALGLVQLAQKHPNLARAHGIAYTIGVILSFLAIAGLLLALRAGGEGVGWGFQLQSPLVVAGLAFLLFGIGLNLLGMFELSMPLPGAVQRRYAQSHGLSGSFFTGILATAVATPCTAPFMGAAVGYAAVQPSFVSLSVFAALGFGLALPYLALSFAPGLRRLLPKPGAWMEIFRQFLAFPMFASAAWLVWVLAQQAGDIGVLGALAGMIALAFGVWVLRLPARTSRGAWTLRVLAALAFVAAIESALWIARAAPPQQVGASVTARQEGAFGEAFSKQKLETLLAGPEPVFVEMTAAWCITCKVNHRVALNISSTRDLFARHGVRYLIGDWTNADPEITDYLESFGRSGVPIYVWYGAPDDSGKRPEPVILPQILTPGLVRDVVEP